MNKFIVNLRSYDSLDKFPDNVLSDFCVKMSNPIELKGQWQVGLSEIQYTNSIKKWICNYLIPLKLNIEMKITHLYRI